jgi:uncharacterized phage-associated protein
MDEAYIRFDRDKFTAVVHFVCSKADPGVLSNVKLHKILYFADMMHFMYQGKPLTGVDYLKQKFGPTARHLSAALNSLKTEKKIEIRERDYFGYTTKDYVSCVAPQAGLLTNTEVALLTDVIDFVSGKSAKEISELSHDVAWQWAELGERIPYAAALALVPEEIGDEDLQSAKAEARRIRPQIETERRDRSLL